SLPKGRTDDATVHAENARAGSGSGANDGQPRPTGRLPETASASITPSPPRVQWRSSAPTGDEKSDGEEVSASVRGRFQKVVCASFTSERSRRRERASPP